MEVVVLMSGGMDSSLVAAMAADQGLKPRPLFVDYGQLAAGREWKACHEISKQLGLAEPERADVSGFGKLIPSGLTSAEKAINEDAFLPGRNALFLPSRCGLRLLAWCR